MATFTELYDLASNTSLRNKVASANHILAVEIVQEEDTVPNHTNRVTWATKVFGDPDGWAIKMLRAVVADNSLLTKTQIENATDAAIKTSCAKIVDAFALNL